MAGLEMLWIAARLLVATIAASSGDLADVRPGQARDVPSLAFAPLPLAKPVALAAGVVGVVGHRLGHGWDRVGHVWDRRHALDALDGRSDLLGCLAGREHFRDQVGDRCRRLRKG